MQFAGSVIPEKLKTPEGKKFLSQVLTYGGAAVLLWWLYHNAQALSDATGNLIDFSIKAILFGFLGIVAIVLYLLAPRIIKMLHNMGNAVLDLVGRAFDIQMFKKRKELIAKNPIENLQMLAEDVEKAISEVDQKINQADGVRIDFVTDSTNLEEEADRKYKRVKGIYAEARKFEQEAKALTEKGLAEKARAKEREAQEYVQSAMMLKQEADADQETAGAFAQYANQFGKAIEILRDNRLAAKMYLKAAQTSIKIIERKLRATSRMRNASEGIAAAFNIKDSWVFQVAMQSAQATISENIATIRNNIQQLNQQRVLFNGTANANRAELDHFIQQMDRGEIKKLNIGEIVDPSHELTSEETVDKGCNIL
ncbi:MAG: hypothetical protein LBG52_06715 [Candidatus Peribacteria bacterium]|nr:hypothetical protein [Candidatus Peribacteria bacterium]